MNNGDGRPPAKRAPNEGAAQGGGAERGPRRERPRDGQGAQGQGAREARPQHGRGHGQHERRGERGPRQHGHGGHGENGHGDDGHGYRGDARARAAQVLERVERDGAYAAPALASALSREPVFSPADRGLCTELVYGVLRTAPALDAALERNARSGSLAQMDPLARSILRIGAYQVLALSRIPPRAAVHSAVEALKRSRSAGLAGFGNAILRKLADAQTSPPPDDARTSLALASVPPSVHAALAHGLGGRDEADAVLRAMFAKVPTMGLRANPLRTDVAGLRERLAREAPEALLEPGTVLPDALRFSHGAHPGRTNAYRDGWFSVQEEGAQCVARAAGVLPGMSVLDACAGRGGKTGALAEALRGDGLLHAAELYPEKSARIGMELKRLGARSEYLNFALGATDLTRGLGSLGAMVPEGGYDVVLLDAPCSGLGTLARRPDLLHRLRDGDSRAWAAHDESDADEERGGGSSSESHAREPLPAVQRALLEQCAKSVRPGGWLVYAVCSLTREEGHDVISAFRAKHGEFAPCEAPEARVPQERLRPSELTLRPDTDGTDGYYVFRLRRAGG